MSQNDKKLRPPKQVVQFAIQESLEVGRILKTFNEIFQEHHKNNSSLIKSRKAPIRDVNIKISGYELGKIISALRDYITLIIANIFDEYPSSYSAKDLQLFNIKGARKMAQIKEILEARNNWVGHINKRYIGPIETEKLYSKEMVSLLEKLQYFTVWTEENKK